MFTFLLHILKSFLLIFIPTGKKLTGFAFVVHPRDYNDVVANVRPLRALPKWLVMKWLHLLPPFTISKIKGVVSLADKTPLTGWVIAIPMSAHKMLERRKLVRRKIQQAIRLAKHLGVRVVGLGGMTGSMTEGGAGLSEKNGMVVTAGRAYTSFVVKSYVDDAIARLELQKKDLCIAIVGAAGGVGSAVTKLILGEQFKRVILIDLERKLDIAREIIKDLPEGTVELTHKISAVSEADIIVTATNAPEAVVASDDIQPGTIIVDHAEPSDISLAIIEARKDILVIEAGVLKAHSSISVGTDFRLANKGELFCCLTEAMAIAASDWHIRYEPRNITPELISKIASIATEMGFRLAPYQAYGRMISEEQIQNVKQIAQNRIHSRI